MQHPTPQQPASPAPASIAPTLFGDDPADRADRAVEPRDAALTAAYIACPRTLDDLPYTDDFDRLYETAGGTPVWISRRDAFRRLLNLRKANRLSYPKASRPGPAVKVTAADEATLARLVVEQVGTLGGRDQLLYDDRFDAITHAFIKETGRALTPHDLWRLVAKLAK